MRLSSPVLAVLIAAALLLVGTALLQSTTTTVRSDPIASVDNGGPRGLLLLRLALDADHVVTVGRDAATLDAVTDPADTVIVVPPPEQSAFNAQETARLRDLAARGARVVVGCDAEPARRKRLRPLVEPSGLRCETLADTTPSSASVDVIGIAGVRTLDVLDRGRLVLDEARAGLLPWTVEDKDGRVVVASAVVGRGELVVLSSMSVFTNDGLRRADNAALLRMLVAGRGHVVVDERHHVTRFDAVVARARLQGPGPRTAWLCALLLVPLALLSWAPRKGELLDDDDGRASSAADRVAGLAALLTRAAPTTAATTTASSTTTTTTTPPPAGAPR